MNVFYKFLSASRRHKMFFAVDTISIIFFGKRVKFFERGSSKNIVGIHKENIFTARKCQPFVARKTAAARIFFQARNSQSPAEFLRVTFDNRNA